MTHITHRPANEQERNQCQSWALWESGETDRFEYHYEQDVEFVVQQGNAVIHSSGNAPVAIAPGSRVTIDKGVHAVWAISAAITNRYQYR